MLLRQNVLVGWVACSCAWGFGVALGNQPAETPRESAPAASSAWQGDYYAAYNLAKEQRKMLLVYFHNDPKDSAALTFEQVSLAEPGVQERLARYVAVKVPISTTIEDQGRLLRLIDHSSFGEMYGRQGLAVVDLADSESPYYGQVVSQFPFRPGYYYLPGSVQIVLDLPAGSLTQRTMVYAVLLHPENPASATGQFDSSLAWEAERHSIHQASITVQGHHNWENRFHQINARLPGGLSAQEVVAESWPGKTLVDACVDCVDSWRQSPGHWGAVRQRHPLFAYDIKRGRNGIWYATGIFGRHR